MRSIRNAAVAGVTALAISLSGVQAFAAEETPATETETSTTTTTTAPAEDNNEGKAEPKKDSSLSTKLSPKYEGDKEIKGTDAFGSSKLPNEARPKWLNVWEGFTIAGIVLTVFTNLIAPAYNYLKYNGII